MEKVCSRVEGNDVQKQKQQQNSNKNDKSNKSKNRPGFEGKKKGFLNSKSNSSPNNGKKGE